VQLLADGQPAAALAGRDEPLFKWPGPLQLSAQLSFTLGGYSGARQVELFAVLFEERPGVAKRDQQPLTKLRGRHELAAGPQRLAFPELWRTDEAAGRRRYRLELEAGVKGGKAVNLVQYFVVDGPPPPQVEIISLDSWNPASARQDAYWQPGDTVQLNLLFELSGNQARRGPNLVVYAVMEEDRYLMGLEEAPGAWQPAQNWDALALPPEDGVYQCVLQARLPAYFGEPWDSQHPFTVHVALDSGAGRPVAAKAEGTLVDYQPGEERREPDLEPRLIRLDSAQRWDIRRIRRGV
jgi:hypothetical protein